ncbi:MAG: hypothetical protein NZ518_08080 [Dehalococcoidia bacterium]|nr:hypothetical protein [Dehalococcoidia bacterium]
MSGKEALVGMWVGFALALAVDGAAAAQSLREALDAVVRGEAREASARGDGRSERLVQAVTYSRRSRTWRS